MSHNSLKLIESYLDNRKQAVYFNNSHSQFKNIGNHSSHQETTMASLIYVINVLDQPVVTHLR